MFFLFKFPMLLLTGTALVAWWFITTKICKDKIMDAFINPIRQRNRIAQREVEIYKQTIPHIMSYFKGRGEGFTADELVELIKKLTLPNTTLTISFLDENKPDANPIFLSADASFIKKFKAEFNEGDASYTIPGIYINRSDMPTTPIQIYPKFEYGPMWTETNEKYMLNKMEEEMTSFMTKAAIVLVVGLFLFDLIVGPDSGTKIAQIVIMPLVMWAFSSYIFSEVLDNISAHKCPDCGAYYSRYVSKTWDDNVSYDHELEKEYDEDGNVKDFEFVKYVEYDTHTERTCKNCGEVTQTVSSHYHQA